MSAGRSASFCLMIHFLLCLWSLLFMVCFVLRSSEAQKIITAVVGQDVTLPCKVNNNNNNIPIIVVEWNRPELEPDYVLLYRDGKFISGHQHPSYVNRVDLQDREMKDGDVSLILKDVKMNDTGTYECRVFQRETNRRKRSTMKLINIIYLVVGPSGDKDGGDKDGGDKDGGGKDGGGKDGGDKAEGHKAGGDKDGGVKVRIIFVVVGLILLLVVSVGFLIYRRHKRQNSNLPGEQML